MGFRVSTDGSMVRSNGYCSRGYAFGPSALKEAQNSLVTPTSRDPMPSSGLLEHYTHVVSPRRHADETLK